MERVDHIVIGAGVVGAATARVLAARGRSVVLVEQFARGHDRGSSHGASRIFRQGYAEAEYVAMTERALGLWRALEAEVGEEIVTLTGAVDHGRPEVVAAIARALDEAGIAAERLTPAEASLRWPGLAFEGAVLAHATAGRIRADRAVEAFLTLAERDGAELRFDTPVQRVSIAADGSARVELGSAGAAGAAAVGAAGVGVVLEASGVVAAVGSWAHPLLGPLLRERGVDLPPVRVTEEQPAHFATDVPEGSWPSFVHHRIDSGSGSGSDSDSDSDSDSGSGSAAVPSVYGLFTPGEGVKVGFHGTGRVIAADDRTSAPDPEQRAALVDYVRRFVPGADVDRVASISCLYDNTPDEDFVLDRTGPLTVATGFSGHGFKFAPLLGEMLADLAMADPAVSDPAGHARPRFAFRA